MTAIARRKDRVSVVLRVGLAAVLLLSGPGAGYLLVGDQTAGAPLQPVPGYAAPPRFLALFAGIDGYEPAAGLPWHRFAVNDAIGWAHILVNRLQLVRPQDAWLAVDTPASGAEGGVWKMYQELRDAGVRLVEPERIGLLEALAEMRRQAEARRLPVWISLSAHAIADTADIWILPRDWRPGLPLETALPLNRFHHPHLPEDARNFFHLDLFPHGLDRHGRGMTEAQVLDLLRRIPAATVLLPGPLPATHTREYRGHFSLLTSGMEWATRHGAVPDATTGVVRFPEIHEAANDWIRQHSGGFGPNRPWLRLSADFAALPLAFDPTPEEMRRTFIQEWQSRSRRSCQERLAWAARNGVISAATRQAIDGQLAAWEAGGDIAQLQEHAPFILGLLDERHPGLHGLLGTYWEYGVAARQQDMPATAADSAQPAALVFTPAPIRDDRGRLGAEIRLHIAHAERGLMALSFAQAGDALQQAGELAQQHGFASETMRIQFLRNMLQDARGNHLLGRMQGLAKAGDYPALAAALDEFQHLETAGMTDDRLALVAGCRDLVERFHATEQGLRRARAVWESGAADEALHMLDEIAGNCRELDLRDRLAEVEQLRGQWQHDRDRDLESRRLRAAVLAAIDAGDFHAAREQLRHYAAFLDGAARRDHGDDLNRLRGLLSTRSRGFYMQAMADARHTGDFARLAHYLDEVEELAAMRAIDLSLSEDWLRTYARDVSLYHAAGNQLALGAAALRKEALPEAGHAFAEAARHFRLLGLTEEATQAGQQAELTRRIRGLDADLTPLLAAAEQAVAESDFAAAADLLAKADAISGGLAGHVPASLEERRLALARAIQHGWPRQITADLRELVTAGEHGRMQDLLAASRALFSEQGWDADALAGFEAISTARQVVLEEWQTVVTLLDRGQAGAALIHLHDGLPERLAAGGYPTEAEQARNWRDHLGRELDRQEHWDRGMADIARLAADERFAEAWARLLALHDLGDALGSAAAGQWRQTRQSLSDQWLRNELQQLDRIADAGDWERLRTALADVGRQPPAWNDALAAPYHAIIRALDELDGYRSRFQESLRQQDFTATAEWLGQAQALLTVVRERVPDDPVLAFWEDAALGLEHKRQQQHLGQEALAGLRAAIAAGHYAEAWQLARDLRAQAAPWSAALVTDLEDLAAGLKGAWSAAMAGDLRALAAARDWAGLQRRLVEARRRLDAGQVDVSELDLARWESMLSDWEGAERIYIGALAAWEGGEWAQAAQLLDAVLPVYAHLDDAAGAGRAGQLLATVHAAGVRQQAWEESWRRHAELLQQGDFATAALVLRELRPDPAGAGDMATEREHTRVWEQARMQLQTAWTADLEQGLARSFAAADFTAYAHACAAATAARESGWDLLPADQYAAAHARLRGWRQAQQAGTAAEQFYARQRWDESVESGQRAVAALRQIGLQPPPELVTLIDRSRAALHARVDVTRGGLVEELIARAEGRVEQQLQGDRRFTPQGGSLWLDWIAGLRRQHADEIARDRSLEDRLRQLREHVQAHTAAARVRF
jgi:hypothetical protein